MLSAAPIFGAGKVKGAAGGIEKGAALFSREGELLAWTVTGSSGRYEFGGIAPGEYMLLLDGRIAPWVRVREGQTTVVDQAKQPKFRLEKELWTPARASFAQSFVARGTGLTGFSLWRPSGKGKLRVSLFENSPAGRRIAGPYETEKELVWIAGAKLPLEQFRTTPGKTYALELAAADGQPWNCRAPATSIPAAAPSTTASPTPKATWA